MPRSAAHPPTTMPPDTRQMYREAIGRRIAESRKLRGVTQDDLAEAIGVSKRALGQWEAGRSMPPADDLGRLSAALGRSVDWIVGRTSGESGVYLINARTEALLLASSRLDLEFRDRHARVAVVADEATEPCATLEEFARRLARIAEHREALSRERRDDGDRRMEADRGKR